MRAPQKGTPPPRATVWGFVRVVTEAGTPPAGLLVDIVVVELELGVLVAGVLVSHGRDVILLVGVIVRVGVELDVGCV